VKSLFSRDKYCDKHKKEAQKSRKLKDRVNYYKRNKKHEMLKQLGTTTMSVNPNLSEPLFYLGVKIPYSEFVKEQMLIHKESKRNNGVTTIYKKGITNNNVWIDNSCHMEYGEPQPSGIQQTHNYASFDDYYLNAKYYLLKDRGSCPDCGCKEHYKSDKDICCSDCGLVLEVTSNLMSWTHQDIIDSEKTKKSLNPLTVQDVAWNKFWMHNNGLGDGGCESGM